MRKRKHYCVADGCEVLISGYHILCEHHFPKLSRELRAELMDCRNKGSGMNLIGVIEQVKDFFKNNQGKEEDSMVNGRSNIIDVTLEYRRETPQSVAFTQGEMEDDGRGGQREIWIWLPKSLIDFEEEHKHGVTCEVQIPEWLAKERNLI